MPATMPATAGAGRVDAGVPGSHVRHVQIDLPGAGCPPAVPGLTHRTLAPTVCGVRSVGGDIVIRRIIRVDAVVVRPDIWLDLRLGWVIQRTIRVDAVVVRPNVWLDLRLGWVIRRTIRVDAVAVRLNIWRDLQSLPVLLDGQGASLPCVLSRLSWLIRLGFLGSSWPAASKRRLPPSPASRCSWN